MLLVSVVIPMFGNIPLSLRHEKLSNSVQVIAGNVATAEGAKALIGGERADLVVHEAIRLERDVFGHLASVEVEERVSMACTRVSATVESTRVLC